MTALVVGTLLALAALSFVLYPLFVSGVPVTRPLVERLPSQSNARQTAAMEALREIEFDRETGKLSDADYEVLRGTYTQRAVEVMRGSDRPECARCGPRPERDASFCSTCGAPIAA